MEVHENEILIYYNPASNSGKKTVAYAQSISKNVRSFSFKNAPMNSRLWRTILDMLELHPREILNKAKPYYQENIRGKEFTDEDWLQVLQNNTDLIKAPIAIQGKKAILCVSATDIYKLQQ